MKPKKIALLGAKCYSLAMKLSEFDFDLPENLIAKEPVEPRDSCRLLLMNKKSGKLSDKVFSDLVGLLDENTVLVFNDSKVIPARILFEDRGKVCEVFVIGAVDNGNYEVLLKPGKHFKINGEYQVNEKLSFRLLERMETGIYIVNFDAVDNNVNDEIINAGTTPLPPYLKDSSASELDYQTVFAKELGSLAAPTAGLHFTDELMSNLKKMGVSIEFITLHVGLGTFMPVRSENIEDHSMHTEKYSITADTADRLNKAKAEGKRIVAVGTTSVRVLESSVDGTGVIVPGIRETDIYIYPGYDWKFVDGLITNFHLPNSTLILLVSAFAGKDNIKNAYLHAIDNGYRFYSFGDAMYLS